MPNDTTQPENTQPAGGEPDITAPGTTSPDTGSGTAGSGTAGTKKPDPTGVEGANPALDDTGNVKAAEVGEAPEPPENPEDLDLTPEGLSDEPAKQEDPDSPAEPENS